MLRRHSTYDCGVRNILFLFWCSAAGNFQTRFLLPMMPVLTFLTTGATERLRSVFRTDMRKLLDSAVNVILILNLPPDFVRKADCEGWNNLVRLRNARSAE
jgi:hypothetical protein